MGWPSLSILCRLLSSLLVLVSETTITSMFALRASSMALCSRPLLSCPEVNTIATLRESGLYPEDVVKKRLRMSSSMTAWLGSPPSGPTLFCMALRRSPSVRSWLNTRDPSVLRRAPYRASAPSVHQSGCTMKRSTSWRRMFLTPEFQLSIAMVWSTASTRLRSSGHWAGEQATSTYTTSSHGKGPMEKLKG